MSKSVTLGGEVFFLRQPGHYAMQDVLELAEKGVDSESAAGYRAISNLVAACMSEQDYARWEMVARRERSTGEDMIRLVLEGLADRPTVRPSDSSDGPPSTATTSTDAAFLRVVQGEAGRPDRQLILLQAQEARTA